MKVASEARAIIHFMIEEKKVFSLHMPFSTTLAETYDAIKKMEEEVWLALEKEREEKAKKEQEKSESTTDEVKDDKTEDKN